MDINVIKSQIEARSIVANTCVVFVIRGSIKLNVFNDRVLAGRHDNAFLTTDLSSHGRHSVHTHHRDVVLGNVHAIVIGAWSDRNRVACGSGCKCLARERISTAAFANAEICGESRLAD